MSPPKALPLAVVAVSSIMSSAMVARENNLIGFCFIFFFSRAKLQYLFE
jgi:hypothetical protein